MKTTYTMQETTKYGHYFIVKTTGTKEQKVIVVTTDSKLYNDWNDGKRVHSKLKRIFKRVQNY